MEKTFAIGALDSSKGAMASIQAHESSQMSQIGSHFALLGNTQDTGEVQSRVNEIVAEFLPGHDLTRINQAFSLLDRAFDGQLSGYDRLKTPYHNRMHTNEVVLCATRMLHGMHLSGHGIDGDHLDAALIGALFHDVGYLMRHGESSGTGAQFTDTHVVRGMDFVCEQITDLPPHVLTAVSKVIQLTDHRKPAHLVQFDNIQQCRAAYATASADLVGQMANRAYLERLLALYQEFREANVTAFQDVHDLLEKTPGFYQLTKSRLDHELGGLAPVLQRHFDADLGTERNLYLDAIDLNLSYLQQVVREDRQRRIDLLRRRGIDKESLDD